MELVKERKIYCLGTKDGKGVKEVLKEHGGVDAPHDYHYNVEGAVFYIHPVTGYITYANKDSHEGMLVKVLFTEVKPLKPKRWRAELGKLYYTIIINNGTCKPCLSHDNYYNIDDGRYNSGNYYRTEEECSKVAEACNKLMYGIVCSEE